MSNELVPAQSQGVPTEDAIAAARSSAGHLMARLGLNLALVAENPRLIAIHSVLGLPKEEPLDTLHRLCMEAYAGKGALDNPVLSGWRRILGNCLEDVFQTVRKADSEGLRIAGELYKMDLWYEAHDWKQLFATLYAVALMVKNARKADGAPYLKPGTEAEELLPLWPVGLAIPEMDEEDYEQDDYNWDEAIIRVIDERESN